MQIQNSCCGCVFRFLCNRRQVFGKLLHIIILKGNAQDVFQIHTHFMQLSQMLVKSTGTADKTPRMKVKAEIL